MKLPQPLAVSIRALLVTLGAAAVAQAQTIQYQAPTGSGGSWNLYEYVLGGDTFKGAHNASNAVPNPLPGQSAPGFLAEIGSAFENTAINQMTYRGDAWIGFTDRSVWVWERLPRATSSGPTAHRWFTRISIRVSRMMSAGKTA